MTIPYWQIDNEVDKLLDAKCYDEALILAEQVYADHPFSSVINQLYALLAAERYDAALTLLEESLEQGFFFPLMYSKFKPVRELARFKVAEQVNDRLKAAAQATAEMEYEVHLPDGYSPARDYPLFLSLHGDENDNALHQLLWEPSTLLAQGYIVVYVQSPLVVSSRGFSWITDFAISRAAVKACYERVCADYVIDADHVLIGGFSGGAIASVEIALAGEIPACGFVALCPSLKPASCTPALVAAAARRGVRGVFMEGEWEGEVEVEQEMLSLFRAAGLPCEFYVNPGIGHWYPADLTEQVQRALAFILNR